MGKLLPYIAGSHAILLLLVFALAVGTGAVGSTWGVIWGYAAFLMSKGKNGALKKLFGDLAILQSLNVRIADFPVGGRGC